MQKGVIGLVDAAMKTTGGADYVEFFTEIVSRAFPRVLMPLK